MGTYFVAEDIGASSTRILGTTNKEVRTLRNNMVFIEDESKEIDLVPTKMLTDYALDVTIKRDEESKFFPMRVLVGDLADRYSKSQVTPNGVVNKTSQRVNYASAILGVAVSLLNENLDEVHDVTLYIALPPNEAKNQKETAKREFSGSYQVTFNKLDKKVKFNVTEVEVYEESYLAMVSFIYHTDSRPKPLSAKYKDGYLLSIDIGASTTDLVIVQNLVYKERSGRTFKTGGNVVRDSLNSLILDTFGFELPNEEADRAVIEGRIRLGNTWKDISGLVANAKRAYADSIINQITNYFTNNGIAMPLMRAFCVSGGGSMASKYTDDNGNEIKTSEPMSFYITEALKQYCDTIEVEHYDEDPRQANIKGLYMRARIDQFQKGKITQAELTRA